MSGSTTGTTTPRGTTPITTIAIACVAVASIYACGSSGAPQWSGGGSSGGANGSGNGGSGGGGTTLCPNGGCLTGSPDGGGGAGSSSGGMAPPSGAPAMGATTAPDCPGCTFPPANAPPCPSSAPAITLVYPPDNVLVPPNLNVVSVQFTPFGAPFQRFEVDFSQSAQSPTTDWHIITACTSQTTDAQSGNPSSGCEVIVDPASWSALSGANRGGSTPVTITVRGTTDGHCASTSTNAVHMSFAEEDLLGTYYYWKSTASSNGTGGQIWKKLFGDLATGESNVTSQALSATCNGCHALSRDGSRMVVYSDDDDSDDEYGDVTGSLLDMTNDTVIGGTGGAGFGRGGGGQPPGFATISPTATYYVSSNGVPSGAGGLGGIGGLGGSYPGTVPANGWAVWNAQTAAFVAGVPIGPAGTRPTMPDWAIDGKSIVYVQPAAIASWGSLLGNRTDDDHVFGGSLYTVPYTGNGTFGSPTPLVLSNGSENDYYPSYSPEMSFVLYNRAPYDASAGSLTGCSGGFCPNDSFSNPAARLMLVANAGGSTPIDLQVANGSAAQTAIALSNSYPRWTPFVQSHHGQKLLWFTFSSTRDYGLRVLNHKQGMYQCYPPDSAEAPGGAHGSHFAAACQEPQLWMAPLNLDEAQAHMDPSGVAFWIPYQDITTHNHTAQWTAQTPTPPPAPDGGGPPPCSCSMVYGPCGAANACGCCSGQQLTCNGNNQCITTPQ
jgi:hypothetical protein